MSVHQSSPLLADFSTATILVVDDSLDNLHLLSSVLVEQGYDVKPVLSGALAITAAKLAPPDLILLDIRMPDMDGYDACRELKTDDRTRDIPVLFLTALNEVDDKIKGFEVGGTDYISKPFYTAELLARIRTHLRIQSLQKELKSSEEKFSTIFQNSPLPISLHSLPDQRYVEVNRSFIEESGYEREEIIGKDSVELDLWADLEQRHQLFETLERQGSVYGFEAQLQNKAGGVIIALLFLEQVNINSQRYLISMGQNVTQQKLAESQLAERTQTLAQTLKRLQDTQEELIQSAKMATLGQSVGGVAHEINTPVGTAILAASALAGEMEKLGRAIAQGMSAPADIQPYVNAAQECSQIITSNLSRAGDMIQSFKQVAVDQASLKARAFNLHIYLEEVLLSLGPEIKHTAHEIKLDGDKNVNLYSYPGALAQVVTNLILNSLTHAYPSEAVPSEAVPSEAVPSEAVPSEIVGKLQLRWQQQDDQVTLIYEDDGRGIAPEHQSQIFEPFFTTAHHRGGSGLGLHLVHRLVTQTLQGCISVTSQVDRGTSFRITIPQILEC